MRMIKRLLIAGGWVVLGIAITLLYCVLDDKVALYLCRRAEAQYNLGLCYANGEGVAQDKAEAVRWYREAAEQGLALAQNNLADCYVNGDEVSQDKAEAVKLYLKAAKQGLVQAQYNVGVCYANGDGVSQDWVEAVKWYRKAAEQGYKPAKEKLDALQK